MVCTTSLYCIKSSSIHETVSSFWYDNCTFVEVGKPILSPSGDGFIKEVKGCINLPTNKILFNPGKGMKGVLGNIDWPFRMLALKIDYR